MTVSEPSPRLRSGKAGVEAALERLQEELKGLGELEGAVHSQACCALLSHPAYGRYLKLDRQGRPHIHRRKVAEEARLGGKYLLRASDDTLSAADVALGIAEPPQFHLIDVPATQAPA